VRSLAALLLLGLLASSDAPPPPTPASFRYQRPITIPPGPPADACAVLDAQVFAHANPLEDLRIYSANQEVPYAVTFSGTAPTGDPASILNLGLKSPRALSFDLQMPDRPYSAVALTLNAHDFLASAHITGLKSLTDKNPTYLGTFTLFDLTTQRLGHSSSVQLAESTFPYLHLDLTLTPAPGNNSLAVSPAIVAAAEIPPSRLAQTLYTPVAETSTITQRPRESVATFTIPAHVPIERVTFDLDPADHTNFSRPVTISAKIVPDTAAKRGETAVQPVQPEQLSGEISRIRLTEAGQEIHQQSLSIPAILGSNEQAPATIEVAIENGDDRPIKLRAVRLEMRQRKLCFAIPTQPATLFYGAPNVPAPVYDFGRLFNATDAVRTATLDAEQLNPQFLPPAPPKQSLTERYPQLLWIALLAVVAILAAIAFRSAKRLG
jgi:hypothetical protein